MKFKIGLRNQDKDFRKISEYIRKILKPEFKKVGYEETTFDDYTSFEGTYINFKHPQRVSKIMVSISTDFDEDPNHPGKWFFISLRANMFHSTMDLKSPIEEMAADTPNHKIAPNILRKNFEYINKISFTKKDLTIQAGLDEFLEESPSLELKIFNEYLKDKHSDSFFKMIGGIGEENSTFETKDDLIGWLKWLGLDIEKIALDNNIDEFLPQEAKDIFLF